MLCFFEDHMEVYIESSKTDQFREGVWVVIARTCTALCPVGLMERYVRVAGVGDSQEMCMFRGLVTTKNGCKLRSTGGLSYTGVRELVLEMLAAIGLDKSK
jgi:hypothetical protein